jgi:hypothetical protein
LADPNAKTLSQSMTDSNLSDETVSLLERVADESGKLDRAHVEVEELIQHLCESYLADDSEEELSDEVAAKQEEFQERIFENV